MYLKFSICYYIAINEENNPGETTTLTHSLPPRSLYIQSQAPVSGHAVVQRGDDDNSEEGWLIISFLGLLGLNKTNWVKPNLNHKGNDDFYRTKALTPKPFHTPHRKTPHPYHQPLWSTLPRIAHYFANCNK